MKERLGWRLEEGAEGVSAALERGPLPPSLRAACESRLHLVSAWYSFFADVREWIWACVFDDVLQSTSDYSDAVCMVLLIRAMLWTPETRSRADSGIPQ